MDAEASIREALAAGDSDRAATELIRLYGPRIIGYLYGVLGDGDDASDAFSIFSEQVWKGIARFEGRSSLRTWAFKAAWSAAMKIRDDAWRRLGTRLDTSDAVKIAEEVRTNTVIRREKQRAELEQLRKELSPEDQSLLILRLDQRLSWEDVAEVLSTDERQVEPVALRKRYERIKSRLAALLSKRTPPDSGSA